MKILLLSAYDAASHQRWRQELAAQFPEHEWTQLYLPPRFFSWRIRGNSLTWAFSERELLSQPYDVLIATSMVDLSALRGLVPALATIPTLLYFHENQFAYPSGADQTDSVEPQIISLYSALCADQLVFNSAFNRASFFAGVEALLRRLPDHVPPAIVDILRERSCVIPVPLQDHCFSGALKKTGDISLVWNHRWEYDKGPERLLSMLRLLSDTTELPPFTVHVVGQQFRQQPAVFAELREFLLQHHRLGAWGFIEDAHTYRQLLRESHIVLSTALHDFQGLAVQDAVAAGCIPVLPARQAYPEWFGEQVCYVSAVDDPASEAHDMARRLAQLIRSLAAGEQLTAPDISHVSWSCLRPRYHALLESLASHTSPCPQSTGVVVPA